MSNNQPASWACFILEKDIKQVAKDPGYTGPCSWNCDTLGKMGESSPGPVEVSLGSCIHNHNHCPSMAQLHYLPTDVCGDA